MSLASDRAVWDAVMKNDVVRELITNGKKNVRSMDLWFLPMIMLRVFLDLITQPRGQKKTLVQPRLS